MGWQDEKLWSDQFLPVIKRIVGPLMLSEAPMEEDAQRNTDLMVLKMDAVRIGCRIRRAAVFDKYREEFTIRSAVSNGGKTELTKIIEGWGDFFFYGFSNEEETSLRGWTLCDLKVFRVQLARMQYSLEAKEMPGVERHNGDGTSFRAFRWDQFPGDFIVETHGLVLPQRSLAFA